MAFPRSIGPLTSFRTSVKGSASIVFSQGGGEQRSFFACTPTLARSFSSCAHHSRYSTVKAGGSIPSSLSSSSVFHRTPPLRYAATGVPGKSSNEEVSNGAPIQWKRKNVSFVTDVEGNMLYFQKWVAQSEVICWESKENLKTKEEEKKKDGCGERKNTSSDASVSTSSLLPATITYFDLDHLVLGFRDDDGTQEFVYGGDAFDQGWDLCFSRALLDFKQRFPTRVHLILGNRDLNKIVMKHLFPPLPSSASAEREERQKAGKEANGASDAFQTRLYSPFGERFLPLTQQRGVKGELSPLAAEEAVFPSKSGYPAKVSYLDYLKVMQGNEKKDTELVADPVSFLKWALIHRLGSSRTFENRREELHALRIQQQQQQRRQENQTDTAKKDTSPALPSPPPPPSDEEVAASFAAAAAPSGVYDQYLQHGQLFHVIHSALFLHGGITEENIGRVPSLHAPYNFPLQGCRCLFDVLPSSSSSSSSASSVSSAPIIRHKKKGDDDDEEAAASTVAAEGGASLPCTTATTSLWNWFSALDAFQKDAVQDFHHWKGSKGEALRRYGNHRMYTLYSITVNSPLHTPYGPSFFPLSVLQPLLMHGLQYMCVGHMPCGDSPLCMRQPPLGSLMFVGADNSYCGRGNATSSPSNSRGDAVTEVILRLWVPAEGNHHHHSSTPIESGIATTTTVAATEATGCGGEEECIVMHGTRADGTPYAFDVRPSEPYLGRCLRRRRPISCGEGHTTPPSSSDASCPTSFPSHPFLKREAEEKWGEVVEDEFWWIKRRGIFPSVSSSKNVQQGHGDNTGGSGKGEACMGDGSAENCTGKEEPQEEYYALHCTKDHFFSEEEILIPSSALARIFHSPSFSPVTASDAKEDPWNAFFLPEGSMWSAFSSVVGGELRNTHTKESLRDVPVSRLKTKVVAAPPLPSS